MIDNLKALALAMVAAFAMSAVAASTASAQTGVFTTDGWATLTGVNTGEAKANSITLGTFIGTCPNTSYAGREIFSSTTGVGNNKGSVTMTPNYGLCATSGFPTTLDVHGCDYVFDLGTTSAADEYNVKTTITCPAGNHIVESIYTAGSFHTAGNAFCEFEFTGTEYNGLKLKDTTNNKLDLTGTIEGFSVDVRRGPDNSILPCPTTETTAILHIDMVFEAGGTAIGLSHL